MRPGPRAYDEVYEIVRRLWFNHLNPEMMTYETGRRIVELSVRFKDYAHNPISGYCEVSEVAKRRERMLAGPGVFADEPEELLQNWRWFS